MPTTLKLCSECINKIRSLPETELTKEQRIFLNAGNFVEGSQPDYTRASKGDDGTCDKCGDQKPLLWYEL